MFPPAGGGKTEGAGGTKETRPRRRRPFPLIWCATVARRPPPHPPPRAGRLNTPGARCPTHPALLPPFFSTHFVCYRLRFGLPKAGGIRAGTDALSTVHTCDLVHVVLG